MFTEQAITLLLDSMRHKIYRGNIVGACFIDLSKACDTISHSNLLIKVPNHGIHGREFTWFTDYLFGRKAVIQYKQARSVSFTITTGVS